MYTRVDRPGYIKVVAGKNRGGGTGIGALDQSLLKGLPNHSEGLVMASP